MKVFLYIFWHLNGRIGIRIRIRTNIYRTDLEAQNVQDPMAPESGSATVLLSYFQSLFPGPPWTQNRSPTYCSPSISSHLGIRLVILYYILLSNEIIIQLYYVLSNFSSQFDRFVSCLLEWSTWFLDWKTCWTGSLIDLFLDWMTEPGPLHVTWLRSQGRPVPSFLPLKLEKTASIPTNQSLV